MSGSYRSTLPLAGSQGKRVIGAGGAAMIRRLAGCQGERAKSWRASRCSATSADHVASLSRRNNRPTHANIVVTVTQEESLKTAKAGLTDRGLVGARVNRRHAGQVRRLKSQNPYFCRRRENACSPPSMTRATTSQTFGLSIAP